MTWVIYNKTSFKTWKGVAEYYTKQYKTEAAAKAQLTRMTKGLRFRLVEGEWDVMPYEDYLKIEPKVTVTNLMSGKPVELKLSEVGGCCDPSTERYHCM